MDCPRWYVKVRLPASAHDPRGVFEIPAPFFVNPIRRSTLELTVEPNDPGVEEAFEILYAASKRGSAEPLKFTFCGHTLLLNPYMQEELLTSVMAFLAAVGFECPLETGPFEPVN